MFWYPFLTSLIVTMLLVTLISLIVNKGYSDAHEVNGHAVNGFNDKVAKRAGHRKS